MIYNYLFFSVFMKKEPMLKLKKYLIRVELKTILYAKIILFSTKNPGQKCLKNIPAQDFYQKYSAYKLSFL